MAATQPAGASLVGEDEIFDAVKDGRVEFDRCLCQVDSFPKLNKSGLGRILGPKGLMPSAKAGTVIKDVGLGVQEIVGASEYKEKLGVIRMAIGQLGFTPEEMRANIKSATSSIKKDIGRLSEQITKEVDEVVSSKTNKTCA